MLVALVLTSFFLPLMTIMGSIQYYLETRRAFTCSLLIALAISVIASGIVDVGQGDLDRYIELLDQYRYATFKDAFTLKYGSLFLTTLWFWIVAKTNMPILLQCSEAFINYLVLFYILFDYANRNNTSNRRVLFAILICFALFPMYFTVQALRSTPALLIGALGIYLDTFRDGVRKLPAWILIIVPIFIHPVGFTVILLRALLFAFDLGRGRAIASIVTILTIPIILSFSALFSPLTSTFNYDVVDILTRYSEWTSGYATRVAESTFQNLLRGTHCFLLIIVLIDCVIINRPKCDTDRSISKLQSIVILISGIELSFIIFITVPSYLRFSYALAPFLSVYIASRVGVALDKRNFKNYFEHRLLMRVSVWDSAVLAFSLVVFVLNRAYTILAVKDEYFFSSILFGFLSHLLR